MTILEEGVNDGREGGKVEEQKTVECSEKSAEKMEDEVNRPRAQRAKRNVRKGALLGAEGRPSEAPRRSGSRSRLTVGCVGRRR